MDKKSYLKGVFAGFTSACVVIGLIFGIFAFAQQSGKDNNTAVTGQNQSASTDKKTGFSGDVVTSSDFVSRYHAINYILKNNYLGADSISEEEVVDGMFHGYLSSIGDKYAAYYSPKEYSDLMEDNQGEYGGIGVYLSEEKDTGRFVIANTFKDEPGDLAGLKAGDIITSVNGESISDKTLDDISEMVKGEPGTEVTIRVYRDGKFLDFTIERKVIELTTVAYEMIEGGKIGYIYISSFDMQTQSQFTDAIDALERWGVKGLIIDVRNNGGGVLTAAIEILDRLLPEGLVLYTENKKGRSGEFYSNAEEYYDKPFCVLINEYSASASEVFAGAVQDFGVAKIIGTRSYGKGVIQTIFPLRSMDDGSGIKVTTEKYFTPKGRNIDGVGIEPDIKVEIDETKEVKKGNYTYDTQMQEAVKYISENIK